MDTRSGTLVAFLDTHVVMWLYDGLVERLSPAAKDLLEKAQLLVSSMVVLELQFLKEIGRIHPASDHVLTVLGSDIGLQQSLSSFEDVVGKAGALSWTRDPFDRLIVAETILHQAKLITKDEMIRKHYPSAVW